ncbi:molybdopterin/thiamine biosynthesis adenylyltransferase [Bradyrhizobium macuxiense]|uniref:Molybdopterin/thiamine biosynthesis adenylyltransferase n=1 Tax=Bradyrhizobium macuxiense TaxID=1755647 RepID=A0A560L8C0_9BRAD|nr:ThiF family adenylyltransferase [Bradyrhizobium macuxiense]TWB89410.1 molybdopterin/thiamine biosynthesis adenylyltransferase [Bradyrhizobium macuxiense]
MTDAIEFSRPAAVAVALGGEDAQDFTKKRALLCGEAATLQTLNGQEAFRASFLLLVRVCENVSVMLPPECTALRAEIDRLIEQFVPKRRPRILPETHRLDEFDAILSVGAKGRRDLPWTVVNSGGWLARVSSLGGDLPDAGRRANAIAAVGAACLGVAEVFKRLIKLRPERGALLDVTSFSLWTYELADNDTGPDLEPFTIDAMLIGCGAIGSGTAYLLSRLPVSGRAIAVDPQDFRRENFGTSIILGEGGYERAKAEMVANLLKPKLDATHRVVDVKGLEDEYDGSLPDIVLAGLDEVDPRHQVQNLWPGLVIDGAVGGDLTCQVSCHPLQAETACLLCVFHKPVRNLSELNARATGLPVRVANDPDAIVTDEMIAAAAVEKRPWLQERRGKRICSITSEAVLNFLSAESQKEGVAPAVPFVSCLSACMTVTELFRYVTTGSTLPAPRFQLNLLWGPHRGVHFEEERRKDCFCVARAANIDHVRSSRGHGN